MIITLNEEEVKLCREAAKNMWATKKRGNYGKGIIGGGKDPWVAVFYGLLGEYAFSKWAGLKTDFSYQEGGVPHDFHANGHSIDVKTSLLRGKRATWYIYKFSESGREIPIKSDIYVFTHLKNHSSTSAEVEIYGFLPKEKVLESPVMPGKGKHYNHEIYLDTLCPMDEFYDYIGKK